MIARRVCVALALVLMAFPLDSCTDLSCSFATPDPDPTSGQTSGATGPASSTTAVVVISATTTTTAPTTTTAASTTTTTLSPMEAYRAQMRAWKNTYGARLADSYAIISTMKDPVHPSPREVQAAADLDLVLAEMVAELEDIRAPDAGLSSTHAQYLASMREMSSGAHDLAEAMKAGKAIKTITAMTGLAVTWEKGRPARTALESALGFSLSG